MSDKIIPFERLFASHEKSQYWSDKNTLKPNQVSKYSWNKFWFNCHICNHEFYTSLNGISTAEQWCPFCSSPPQRLCEDLNCNQCLDKSFLSHDKSKYWSNKNTLTSRQVFKNSDKKYLFNCDCCEHEFYSSPKQIYREQFCPYCAIPSKLLCDNENCSQCYNRSFASHEKAKCWSDKNKINPRQILKCSHVHYWFNCNNCFHDFKSNLSKITHINNSSWCPFCCVPGNSLCDDINCTHCFNRSFASHEKAKYLSDKNTVTPREVLKGSYVKYYFNCNVCSSIFNNRLNNISGQCQWCPYCVNKTEKKLYEILKNKYPNTIKQFKADWCKNKRHLPFDFCLPDLNIIIELDGAQHFIQVSNWKSPEDTQENDKYKEKCANDNSYSVIRILQDDVLFDKYEWFNELVENIEKIKNDKIIQNIYMCKNNEYFELSDTDTL